MSQRAEGHTREILQFVHSLAGPIGNKKRLLTVRGFSATEPLRRASACPSLCVTLQSSASDICQLQKIARIAPPASMCARAALRFLIGVS